MYFTIFSVGLLELFVLVKNEAIWASNWDKVELRTELGNILFLGQDLEIQKATNY